MPAADGVAQNQSSEDCLYLNVWTPAKTSAEMLPVMVWIYGGGSSAGATSVPLYSGEKLAQRGVVVVSVGVAANSRETKRCHPVQAARHRQRDYLCDLFR